LIIDQIGHYDDDPEDEYLGQETDHDQQQILETAFKVSAVRTFAQRAASVKWATSWSSVIFL
jgi:hypothetical protein